MEEQRNNETTEKKIQGRKLKVIVHSNNYVVTSWFPHIELQKEKAGGRGLG